MLVYDVEIKRAIPDRRSPNIEGVEYCQGWDDHAGMGISVVCTYDTQKQRHGVYCEDNREDFYDLVAREIENSGIFASYNGLSFDNKVIKACWNMFIPYSQCYDVLVEVWRAHGLGPTYKYPTHAGFSLDDVAAAAAPPIQPPPAAPQAVSTLPKAVEAPKPPPPPIQRVDYEALRVCSTGEIYPSQRVPARYLVM